MTETVELAHVFLPTSSWAEKEGTYTSTDRRVQRVRSRRGSVECRAWITRRAPPGTVYMSLRFHEAAAKLLIINALDPISKIPKYKICACNVELTPKETVPYSESLRRARA